MTRIGVPAFPQESANYDSRLFPAQRLRSAKRAPSHRIRLQNARLADRDARCVQSYLPCAGSLPRGRRRARRRRRHRAKSSRASRDICDREHARASAQLRGISRGNYAYVYVLPVAFPMRRRDAGRRAVQERGPGSPEVGPATCSDSSTMDGTRTRSRIRSPEGQRERESVRRASRATWIPAGDLERPSTCTCTCRRTTVILAPTNSPPATTVASRDTAG